MTWQEFSSLSSPSSGSQDKAYGVHYNAILDHALEKEADYILRQRDGDAQAIDGSTGKIQDTNANPVTLIQALHDDLINEDNGGLIFLKDYFNATSGVLTVKKRYFRLMSKAYKRGTGNIRGAPHILTINVVADARSIEGFALQGVHTRQLKFLCDGYGIHGATVKHNCITPSNVSGRQGIIFDATSGVMDNFTFFDNEIRTYGDMESATSGYGLVTFIGGQASVVKFIANYFDVQENYPSDVVRIRDGFSQGGGVISFTGNNTFTLHGTISPLLRLACGASGLSCFVLFDGFWWETDSYDNDIFVVDNGAGTARIDVAFNHVFAGLSDGDTHQLINNAKASAYTAGSRVIFENGFRGTDGTFQIGTTQQQANLNVIIEHFEDINRMAASTPSVGASPDTKGPYPYMARFGVFGGTVSAIVIRSQDVGQTSGWFTLYPGDTITTTYSDAPSYKMRPL